ncbi:universal stress protein [Saccharibacillus endophyticus]|uniref:Potassium-transporting P-type ATPase D chain n=1 Tax=Saccharibacillus endophyticus TaxID=2060666 RepID=A0ABQ2A2P5_9BACL|nr:universal stress protein [Saccharibacillus endophyticus]GGH83125.1 potassium-transporting P-type ATPase D chain [Saccharibacillus endophyticus]
MPDFKRKSPEEILQSIQALYTGRLKIIIGAISGSGKTYHMLRDGQTLQSQGVDVVICAVSTMQRPETMEQLQGLERIPSIHWKHADGSERKDLDVDAIVSRNPEVLLTDGLAHRNRPGAPNATRLDDIRFLLEKGISVIATVNVYELQGVTEMARKLIGIEVKETVPADTLELADEVRLIDVTPEALLARIEDGLLKNMPDKNLFSRGNIGVLRELTLRLVAEGVNGTLLKYRDEQGYVGASGTAEHILVSAQYHWNGSIHIRRGQQIAQRLGGELSVVTFVNPGEKLGPEREEFRRSIRKLCEKIGATLHEIHIRSRRDIPPTLTRLALEQNVSRIVIGHSNQTRSQEFFKGSIVAEMVKCMRNVDMFVVADRTSGGGERILPTKRKEPLQDPAGPYRRLSQEQAGRKIEEIKRGRFKVYIGAAPGVGKTYTMLREGNILRKKKIDVVIGLLETHGRQETQDQVSELELVPRAIVPYKGAQLQEMDADAIIARDPEVVLVDELAHTNVPGSVNKKRYEDVIRLLNAGISVISTLNVQHLESLNDNVEQLTGVRVRETVPDSLLSLADEVELIDVTPKALQERMRAGRIYAREKVDQALGNFFKTGNLIALRELALREIADDVDERLESWERKTSLRGPWRREEVIFVAVTLSDNAERLIRRGFRIAYRLKAPWHVCYIPDGECPQGQERERIEQIKRLTRRLGGSFDLGERVPARRLHEELLMRADARRCTQLIVGQSRRSKLYRLLFGSLTQRLLRTARHMDLLVVARFDHAAQVKKDE